ncbi:MAG: M20/M25/M40 family metallo-hydrolase [Deltaproteobacteria bacterium]|nr:M20/M25/M40 family metallo-hydrolase [Deltaproteobacteria bacterium]
MLSRLVAFDTVSPPGNEIAAANWVRDELTKNGITAEVLSPDGKRGNVIARLKGDGSKRPVLLLAHLDVVGFTRAGWKSDPLSLVERDGFLFGRGVADDKGMAAFLFVAFVELARAKLPLTRDVILALTADEESGGDHGVQWLLKHHREKLDAEFALNEGGQVRLFGDKVQVGVQTGEKLYLDVDITARGKSGHSSVPSRQNAIHRLANAIAHLSDLEFPIRLNATTRGYFAQVAPLYDGDEREALLQVASNGKDAPRAAEKLAKRPYWNSLLRTTCIATVVKGGIRVNALPSEARANVNCRIAPDDDPAEIVAKLKAAANDPKLTWKHDLPARAPESPVDGAGYRAIVEAAQRTWPGSTTVAFMSTGGTDSRWLRAVGIPGYGVTPYPAARGVELHAHGHNERIPVRSLVDGPRFVYEFLISSAVKK